MMDQEYEPDREQSQSNDPGVSSRQAKKKSDADIIARIRNLPSSSPLQPTQKIQLLILVKLHSNLVENITNLLCANEETKDERGIMPNPQSGLDQHIKSKLELLFDFLLLIMNNNSNKIIKYTKKFLAENQIQEYDLQLIKPILERFQINPNDLKPYVIQNYLFHLAEINTESNALTERVMIFIQTSFLEVQYVRTNQTKKHTIEQLNLMFKCVQDFSVILSIIMQSNINAAKAGADKTIINSLNSQIEKLQAQLKTTNLTESLPLQAKILYIEYLSNIIQLNAKTLIPTTDIRNTILMEIVIDFFQGCHNSSGYTDLINYVKNICNKNIIAEARSDKNFLVKKLDEHSPKISWSWLHAAVWFSDFSDFHNFSLLLNTISAKNMVDLFPQTTAVNNTWNNLRKSNVIDDITKLSWESAIFYGKCSPQDEQSFQSAVAKMFLLKLWQIHNCLNYNMSSMWQHAFSNDVMITDWWMLLQQLKAMVNQATDAITSHPQSEINGLNALSEIHRHIYLANSAMVHTGIFASSNQTETLVEILKEIESCFYLGSVEMLSNALLIAFDKYYNTFLPNSKEQGFNKDLADKLLADSIPCPNVLAGNNLSLAIAYMDKDTFKNLLETEPFADTAFDSMVGSSHSDYYPLLHLLIMRGQDFLNIALNRMTPLTVQSLIKTTDWDNKTILKLAFELSQIQDPTTPMTIKNNALMLLLSILHPTCFLTILLKKQSSPVFLLNSFDEFTEDLDYHPTDVLVFTLLLIYARVVEHCYGKTTETVDKSDLVVKFCSLLLRIDSLASDNTSSPGKTRTKDKANSNKENQDPSSFYKLRKNIIALCNCLQNKGTKHYIKDAFTIFSTYLANRCRFALLDRDAAERHVLLKLGLVELLYHTQYNHYPLLYLLRAYPDCLTSLKEATTTTIQALIREICCDDNILKLLVNKVIDSKQEPIIADNPAVAHLLAILPPDELFTTLIANQRYYNIASTTKANIINFLFLKLMQIHTFVLKKSNNQFISSEDKLTMVKDYRQFLAKLASFSEPGYSTTEQDLSSNQDTGSPSSNERTDLQMFYSLMENIFGICKQINLFPIENKDKSNNHVENVINIFAIYLKDRCRYAPLNSTELLVLYKMDPEKTIQHRPEYQAIINQIQPPSDTSPSFPMPGVPTTMYGRQFQPAPQPHPPVLKLDQRAVMSYRGSTMEQ